MKFLLFCGFVVCSSLGFSQSTGKFKLKKGPWLAELQLNEVDMLPFQLSVSKNNQIAVRNGDESILLEISKDVSDTICVRFPYFNSELVVLSHSKKMMNGYWVNYNKGVNYKIPFSASFNKSNVRFKNTKGVANPLFVDGRWQVAFEPNTSGEYPAVGIFKQSQNENRVLGTYLTETGDYRFLEGNCTEDSLFLSCFDGSHAFLFKALYRNDSLLGTFNSGKHWKAGWNAIKNDAATLRSPEDLTHIKESAPLSFKIKDLSGNDFIFPNNSYKNKVVIIQIMGSWCPNCLDETQYYKELYSKYHDQGLEIISIGYETGSSFDDYVNNMNRLKDKLDLDFTFLVGGAANKELASQQFSMLNEVISFPTSIFIGKDGRVVRVHTGFNGPGTGSYYTEYKEKTGALIEGLLNQ